MLSIRSEETAAVSGFGAADLPSARRLSGATPLLSGLMALSGRTPCSISVKTGSLSATAGGLLLDGGI
jgi:hypothetical protein